MIKKNCINDDLPEKLYRYRSLNNLGRVIQEISCLHWFSTAQNLNDPFDGIAGIPEKPVDQLKILKYKLEGEEEYKHSLHHVVGTKKWMVACFNQDWRSAPMWAHYASNGSGICLVYDPKIIRQRLFEYLNIPLFATNETPLFNKVDYVKNLPSESADKEERIFSKAKSWEYENEWRVALLGLEQEDRKGGMMVNLHGAISQVLIGWNAGAEVYTPIIDAVNKLRRRGEEVKVGIIRIEEATRELRIDWPWSTQLLELGRNK